MTETARRPTARGAAAFLARDPVVLAAVLIVAALTRLPGLAARGRFDGDQGHDMLVLLQFTRDGMWPLLGPPTSIGDFHHGAFYYYLLAPFAWISGSDPTAVIAAIALMGVAAVGVTWWLARTLGGPLVGLIAGLLLAVSPAAIEESTFIWNPNPIPLFAAVAIGAAWRGRATGRARWWVLALGAAGAVLQLHVLGVVFLPPILALLVVELRRAASRRDRAASRRLWGATLAGVGVIALLFVPLAVHELESGFSETQRILAYLRGGGGPSTLDPMSRLVFTGLRLVGWPLVGLVTDVPGVALVVFVAVLALVGRRVLTARAEKAVAIRWLAGTVVWSALALSVLAPSLQTVVPGLPNDHYHAFLDPIVLILVALAGVGEARRAASGARTLAGSIGRAAAAASRPALALALIAVIGIEVVRWPPAVDPNGGWPAAEVAGARITALSEGAPVSVLGLPAFKPSDGTGFPIVRAGGALVVDPATARYVVVPCDRLFEDVLGASCGGPAEDRAMAALAAGESRPMPTLVSRFDQSPRVSVSIYRR